MTDMAGNILYSDPTNPQVFTIISNNGQYSGIITYPSREGPVAAFSSTAGLFCIFAAIFRKSLIQSAGAASMHSLSGRQICSYPKNV